MMGNWIGNWGAGPGGFLGFGFGGIFMLLFWVLIIWALIALIRGGSGHGFMCGHTPEEHLQKNSPLDILKERYAKGEINQAEFEQKKKDLS